MHVSIYCCYVVSSKFEIERMGKCRCMLSWTSERRIVENVE